MNKVLIASGCSFTETKTTKNWPFYLNKYLPQYHLENYGMSSQGNGIIARSVIWAVSNALEKYSPKDILVGIMWSSFDRTEFHCEKTENLHFIRNKIYNGWFENPTGFIPEHKNWVILNHHWGFDNDVEIHQESKTYYENFYSEVGALIYSLEHIHRVQLFLQHYNIPYFFTNTYRQNSSHNNNIQLAYLIKLIDKQRYLPIENMHDWLTENYDFSQEQANPEFYRRWKSSHPTQQMSKFFVDQVILPYVKQQYPFINIQDNIDLD